MADIFDVDNQENYDLGQSFEPSEESYLDSLDNKPHLDGVYSTGVHPSIQAHHAKVSDNDFYSMMAQQTWIPEQAKKSDWNPMRVFEGFNDNEADNMLKWDNLNAKINTDRAQLESWGKSATNPSHYNEVPAHLQHWDVVAQMGWCYHLGCATKYIWRAGKKASSHLTKQDKEIEDLQKAIVYIQKRIDLLTK